MKHGHDNIFTKTGKKYGQYQWAEQTISEWVVEDRVLPLGDGGRGGGTTEKLWKDDNNWRSVEKGHPLNIWGKSINTKRKRRY